MVNPLALLALLAAKKALAIAIYNAGSRYGWPRVYRRLLEANLAVTPEARREAVARALALSFRAPDAAARALQSSDAFKLATHLAENLARQGGAAKGAAAALLHRAVADGGAVLEELANIAHGQRPPRQGGGGGMR